ncbi:histone transcription regulator 3 homolog [[Candida] anglica]
MSAFIPSNLTEDPATSKKDLEEEHTREIQIEQAFKLFQKALELQKKAEYIEAYHLYEDLFKLEVISNHYYEEEDYIKGLQNGGSNNVVDELSFLSPNVKLLRYLVFRNRGFLYYNILKEGIELDSTDNKQVFYSLIDDLIICFIYQEVDEEILKVLYQIFSYLKILRLERYTIEYSLASSSESEDILGLLPKDRGSIKKLNLFWNKLSSMNAPIPSIFEQSLAFLEPIRKDFEDQKEKTRKLIKLDVEVVKGNIDKLTWISVIENINATVKKMMDKAKGPDVAKSKMKDIEGYLLCETPIERINFECENDQMKINEENEHKEESGDDEHKEDELKEDEDMKNEEIDDKLVEEREDKLDEEIIDEDDETTVSKEFDIQVEEEPTKLANDNERDENNNNNNNNNDNDSSDNEEFFEAGEELPKESYPLGHTDTTGSKPDIQEKEETPGEGPKDEGEEEVEEADPSETETITSPKRSKPATVTPSIKRSSKRLRVEELAPIEDVEITAETFVETSRNFTTINAYLSKLSLLCQDTKSEWFDNEPFQLQDVVDLYFAHETVTEPKSASSQFLRALSEWNKSYTTLFINSTITGANSDTAEVEKQRLLDVLNSFEMQTSLDLESTSEQDTPSDIIAFLKQLNESNMHLEDVKYAILHRLLVGVNAEFPPIAYVKWNPKLIKLVKEWVQSGETMILNRWRGSLWSNEHQESEDNRLTFSVGVFEILVDLYMSLRSNLTNACNIAKRRPPSKSNRFLINSLHLESVKLHDKMERWNLFIDDLIAQRGENNVSKNDLYRYKWAITFKEKATGNPYNGKMVTTLLYELTDEIKSSHDDVCLELPNYEHISRLSEESIKSRLNTTEILSVFSRILNNEYDSKRLLEDILFKTQHEQEETTLKIKEFLLGAQVDMTVSLWNILFSIYSRDTSIGGIQLGFGYFLEFLIEYITSHDLQPNDVIKVVGCYGDYLLAFLTRLQANNWDLVVNQFDKGVHPAKTIHNLLKMFSLLYLFSLHEEAAMINSTKTSIMKHSIKAYGKLKDIFVQTLSLLFIYLKFMEKSCGGDANSRIHSLVVTLHEQLRLRRLCDAGNGLFLDLAQDVLSEVNSANVCAEADLMQVISCRYHYNLTFGKFTPMDHETTKTGELDMNSTFELSQLILPLCFKTNPILQPPKADMKMIIDAFNEVVGEPDIDNLPVLSRNNQLLEYYLSSTSLSPKFLRDSFHGLANVGFEVPSSTGEPRIKIVQDGLYYLQGLLVFTAYKIRKKSMQSRAVELENIINLLKNDLIFGSNRVESWFLLAQAYGYLVEDDLIWTSDKLIFPERKTTTANLQRRSLICYSTAINEALKQSPVNGTSAVLGSIMSHFAKEMYNACMPPMEMHSFRVLQNPKFIRKATGASFVSVSENSPTKLSLCYKIMQQSLHLAIKQNSKDWTNFYYLSKIQRKLQLDPQLVLQTLQESSDLAKVQSNPSDPIVEPHYRMCSVAYKYVKEGKLSTNEAVKYLKEDQVVGSVKIEDSIESESDSNSETIPLETFYKHIIQCLKKVMAYDKKKWHHKPKYRLAYILFYDLHDTAGAKEEMSSIVSLKITSKTLVSIWKPENERPGKHFHYTYEYAVFYIILLTKELNLTGLIQMLPKLRRSNSTMISLSTAWESLCSSICRLVRNSIGVTENFTENFLQTSSHNKFVIHSKALLERIHKDGKIAPEYEIYTCFLFAISDMKKYNNGYGPTSLIDDTIVAVYMRVYLNFTESHSLSIGRDETASPSSKPKKMAKRDVFPLIAEILKTSRREIEELLKEKTDIYNEFIQRAAKEREEKEKEEKEKAEKEEEERKRKAIEASTASSAVATATTETSGISNIEVEESIRPVNGDPAQPVERTPTPQILIEATGDRIPKDMAETPVESIAIVPSGEQVSSSQPTVSDIVEIDEIVPSKEESEKKRKAEDNDPSAEKKQKTASETVIID